MAPPNATAPPPREQTKVLQWIEKRKQWRAEGTDVTPWIELTDETLMELIEQGLRHLGRDGPITKIDDINELLVRLPPALAQTHAARNLASKRIMDKFNELNWSENRAIMPHVPRPQSTFNSSVSELYENKADQHRRDQSARLPKRKRVDNNEHANLPTSQSTAHPAYMAPMEPTYKHGQRQGPLTTPLESGIRAERRAARDAARRQEYDYYANLPDVIRGETPEDGEEDYYL